MLQTILKDGKKMRFVNGIPQEYLSQIEHQVELTEEEVLKVPEVVDGKLTMRDKTKAELDAEKAIVDAVALVALKEKKIALKQKIDSGIAIDLDMSSEQTELDSL